MKKLYVYADFDWLEDVELMGELQYEQLRGKEHYGFQFSNTWIQRHSDIHISPDLFNFSGLQFVQPEKDIFGCLSDTLPDRWGRMLMQRREQTLSKEQNRPIRKLTSFDYLLGIDDFARMGGFRFKESPDADFINSTDELTVPPITDIDKLWMACREVEQSESQQLLPEKKWLFQLIQPGSSLGGARPKANVMDNKKRLFVAKFPSRNDDYDVGLWEYLCNILANKSGILTAEARVMKIGDHYHTFLSKRFDRTENSRRIHFASAMTMLGLVDGDDADTGRGYLDMVDFIIQHSADVQNNLKELYRRVAFNICVGNTDDHFRDHGFLLTPKGWTLSPVYDVNPSLNEYQSLLIDETSNLSDLNILLNAAKSYFLTRQDAANIIRQVVHAVREWRQVAAKLSISKREQERFSTIIDNRTQGEW